jgi:hypothetical protein
MVSDLERLGLYDNGVFHRSGEEINVRVLGLGITKDPNNPCGYIPEGTNAYVVGDRESPTSNKFPVIYLKIIED